MHILLRSNAETKAWSVWLSAPFDADIKNSLAFSKLPGARVKKEMADCLLYQAGVPENMPRLSEPDTLETLEKIKVTTPQSQYAFSHTLPRLSEN